MTDQNTRAVEGPLHQPVQPVAAVEPCSASVRLAWASLEAAHNAKPGPLYDQAALDVWRNAAHEAASLSRHMHNRNGALMLLISDMGAVMARMGAGIDHLAEIARQWEPDHSSGADRAGWVRAKDAADDARRLIAEIPARMRLNDQGKRTPEARSAVGGPLDPPVRPLVEKREDDHA